jgi:hypothetical protein
VSDAREPGRDGWDKAEIILRPVGGLLTALAVAIVGFWTSSYLRDRESKESALRERMQTTDTNARLYSELISKREESESALRKDMFKSIIDSFLRTGSSSIEDQVLNLELLVYNFHESLNLKPLFLDLKRRIAQSASRTHGAAARAEYQGYMDRLERVAREIARKQVIVLEGVGTKFDRSIDLSADPSGESLEPATLTLDSLHAAIGIDVLSVDKASKELEVSLSVETPDPKLGRQTKTASFTVSYYDFPMIDNTRLTGGDRCAIVLNGFSDYSADITVVLFPGAYASLKEKPYYSEVLESVRRENARMAK